MTHRNLLSVASSIVIMVKRTTNFDSQERYISYLPLAHMYERANQIAVVMLYGSIGFYEGDIKRLVDNIKELKPTIFSTVPRLLNRIYAKVQENLSKKSIIERKIFELAFAQKEKEVLRGINRKDGFWDFAFKQIRAIFGGELRYVFTGSAPASPDVSYCFKAFKCDYDSLIIPRCEQLGNIELFAI
jgi:long-chain acyl-CoA synthetase